MLVEYARFVQEIFPPINPETAKKLIAEASKAGMTDEQHFATDLGDKLCQGDVVEDLTWVAPTDDGSYGKRAGPGMLLSHSCDVDNDEWITFAPCFPFTRTLPAANYIERNEVFDVYYLPAHQRRPPTVADFSRAQSMAVRPILTGIQNGTLLRVDSFTREGHYHFILKLTLHFLRPQSEEEIRYECQATLSERLRYSAKASLGLLRYAVHGASN